MLRTGHLPTRDTWSWTVHGHGLVVSEWFFDLLLGLVARGGGASAVSASVALCLLVGWGVYGLCRGAGEAGVLGLAVLVLAVPREFLLPQLLFLAPFAAVCCVLEPARRRGAKARPLRPLLCALWVHTNGTLFIGLALVVLEVGLAWWPWRLPTRVWYRVRRSTRRWLPVALGAILAACLVNPHGRPLIDRARLGAVAHRLPPPQRRRVPVAKLLRATV